jgi:methylenetetrahydrofolate dehydrogenase (NADP+)/methenyltetrahydrofolate cyclohydrolase
MSAQLLDGKAIAAQLRMTVQQQVAQRVESGLAPPGLAVILIGDDAASQVYVRNKRIACEEVGFHSELYTFPPSITQDELMDVIDELNANPQIDGILVQLPIPATLDTEAVIERIDPQKDVDGFHPYNVGRLLLRMPLLRPCTPKGVMTLLEHTQQPLEGRAAVVIGQSHIVGRPMALELLAARCTVTICHSRTQQLEQHVRSAEVLVVAIGQAELIPGHWIKPGAIVVDVGMNRTAQGRLTGDVQFATAAERAAWITPVPGGVGPMTIASLLENTLLAAERRSASAS